MGLQEEADWEQKQGGGVSAERLVHYSRLYRATLQECVDGLTMANQGELLLSFPLLVLTTWCCCSGCGG